MKKYSPMKRANCFCVLRTSRPRLYTATLVADPDALIETPQPDLGCF